MKKYGVINAKNGYAVINDALTAVNVIKTISREDAGGGVKIVHVVRTTPDGTDIEVKSDSLYASAEGFQNGNPIAVNMLYITEAFNVLSDGEEMHYWTFEDGEPVNHIVHVSEVSVNYGDGSSPQSPDIPSDCYKTRQEALSWNEFVVREEDGTERTVVGEAKKLLLNNEQRAALKAFEDAKKKLDELKVRILQIENICYAINASDEEFSVGLYDCDRYAIEEGHPVKVDIYCGKFKVNAKFDYAWCDNCYELYTKQSH